MAKAQGRRGVDGGNRYKGEATRMGFIYAKVERARVSLTKKGGQGVLVNGHLVLTAAHCIDFTCTGGMVLGDYCIETINAGGRELKAAVVAVEPVSDIAVLGTLDNQVFYKEAEDFESFCAETKPVPLCKRSFVRFREFGIHVYTHKGTWIRGIAVQYSGNGQQIAITTCEQIEGGTSGSPVINDRGELVGIVSTGGSKTNLMPRPHLALPVWVRRRIYGYRPRPLRRLVRQALDIGAKTVSPCGSAPTGPGSKK